MSDAVYIRNLNFSYGKQSILKNFNARIPYSKIYALLGPSGGGKTTLLKLILGRLKPPTPDGSTILVLGQPPGEQNSNISFMPQELGLCDNLTINQTLKYFKLIYRISNEEYYIRRKELTKLTNLPDGHLLVKNLSGGTKRRLSIAVALINNPSLVILDEPTVGIDALLRQQIWNYFLKKTYNDGMTMIIVTHYIEEASNAGCVGLLRNGQLLAEDNPIKLMKYFNEPNLESVFLKLCFLEDENFRRKQKQKQQEQQQQQNHFNLHPPEEDEDDDSCYDHHHPHHPEDIFIISSKYHLHPPLPTHHQKVSPTTSSTIIQSDCSLSNCSAESTSAEESSSASATSSSSSSSQCYSPPTTTTIEVISSESTISTAESESTVSASASISESELPSSRTSKFESFLKKLKQKFSMKLFLIKFFILLTLISRNLKKFLHSYFSILIILLPATQGLIFCLAVSKDLTLLPAAVFDEEPPDDPETYGRLFLQSLKPLRRHWIHPIQYYQSLEEIQSKVEQNLAIGAIHIPRNFSESLESRIEDGFTADNETIENSSIRIFLDNSHYTLSMEFYLTLLESFLKFSQKIFQDKYLLEIPIEIQTTSVSKNYRFNDYYMPGYFLIFIYISQITIASLTLNKERKDGLFERSLIAGVTHELVFLSHIITNLILSILQLLMLDLIAFGWFSNPSNSSYWLKTLLFLLESLSATSIGFIISSLVDSEVACLIMVWFITVPQFLSSGIFWPMESLSPILYYLFYILWPLSIPVKTCRHILLQGWDLNNQQVQLGFLAIILPMLIFFYLALWIFKRR